MIMDYKYIIDHVNNHKRTRRNMDWEYITIHNTGNPRSTAKNERGWLTNISNTNSTGYHIVIDEKDAIEVAPLNEIMYHAGDGRNGEGNTQSIGIEICESGNYEQTLKNAVHLVARLLKEKGYGVDKVKQHFNWSKKNCPRLLRQGYIWNWDRFIIEIQEELDGMNEEKEINNIPLYKKQGMLDLAEMGYLNTPDEWIKKADEPMPVWASMLIMSRIAKDIQK